MCSNTTKAEDNDCGKPLKITCAPDCVSYKMRMTTVILLKNHMMVLRVCLCECVWLCVTVSACEWLWVCVCVCVMWVCVMCASECVWAVCAVCVCAVCAVCRSVCVCVIECVSVWCVCVLSVRWCCVTLSDVEEAQAHALDGEGADGGPVVPLLLQNKPAEGQASWSWATTRTGIHQLHSTHWVIQLQNNSITCSLLCFCGLFLKS